jgi:hypothetical protein
MPSLGYFRSVRVPTPGQGCTLAAFGLRGRGGQVGQGGAPHLTCIGRGKTFHHVLGCLKGCCVEIGQLVVQSRQS